MRSRTNVQDTFLKQQLAISGAWCLIVLVLAILGCRVRPGVIVGVDVLLWMLTLGVGVSIAAAPVTDIDRLDCSGPNESATLCRPDHDNTVIWRVVGATFCLLNS